MPVFLLAAKSPPNLEALALGPTIGWLTFLCALAVGALILLDRERWRRFWLRTEDPRAIAAFRVAFCVVLLININNMWQHFELLFTDEGLFMTDSARQNLARRQFAGYGEGVDGEPVGFFDGFAMLRWLRGPRYSLLYFWDSPPAFYTQLAIWELATVAFLVGFRTRLSGVISLVLTLGFMGRNPIYMSGADSVFRVMFIYLVLAKSGHAYSIDNWLRCRRLARAGELDTREGPGGGAGVAPSEAQPGGLAAIYRRIPAWPRTLIILQLATIYFWTGCAKTGRVWWRGDSLYYALNLDHFNRVPTQFIGYVFGTNVFRIMTWTVHFWQIGFPLVVLGLIVRWARRERLEPPTGWRRWGLRAAWTVLGLGALAIIWVGLPVHYPVDKAGIPAVRTVQWLALGAGLGLMVGIAWGWHRLRERPFEWTLRGRTLTLDLDRFFSIFAGRKFWLTLGLLFHLHILVLMNIGMFAPVMIAVYVAVLNGTEVAILARRVGRGLARLGVPGIPAWVARGERITPTEDRSLPQLHHDRRAVPTGVIFAGFAFVAAAVLAKVQGHGFWWWSLLVGIFTPLVYAIVARVGEGLGRGEASEAKPEPDAWTWAYGWFGRAFVGTLIAVHLAALAAHSIPDKDCTASFRKPARAVVLPWVQITQTYQSWNMFAPNPTRSNVFMKVFVTDQDGQLWDLYTDVNSPRNKVSPWLIYDRMGKITRRVTGDAKHYQKWIARYHCRKWALEHDGQLPRTVEIIKQWYAVPPPKLMRERGPYDPAAYLEAHGKQKRVYRARCATEPDAQPTNEIRRRHGLASVPDSEIHRATKPRLDRWQRRHEIEAERERREAAKAAAG
ncbi:hypothetical protein ENSA5_25060 [Enhygromyxa salina]|uniref:HTTM-like domain-containing protein n=1 Tax=Enhygromyxa salina TaxID=215803 RepID=A0A2S9YAY3_9BACT|nr:hypothetical protein [Enhygromyxa salina]PRQ02270.1 hypothetical protein ENSA5_25060 [Enhygromyxa salina]